MGLRPTLNLLHAYSVKWETNLSQIPVGIRLFAPAFAKSIRRLVTPTFHRTFRRMSNLVSFQLQHPLQLLSHRVFCYSELVTKVIHQFLGFIAQQLVVFPPVFTRHHPSCLYGFGLAIHQTVYFVALSCPTFTYNNVSTLLPFIIRLSPTLRKYCHQYFPAISASILASRYCAVGLEVLSYEVASYLH